MRIKLHLRQEKPDQLIPINYQYGISSFIYNTIGTSDSSYSGWLHDTGFASGNKKFKFFTFSRLDIPKRKIIDNKLQVLSEEIQLIISLYGNKSLENFVTGMFTEQKLKLFNRTYEASFYINTIESEPEPEYKEVMKFKTLSPIVISKKVESFSSKSRSGGNENRNIPKYLAPDDPDYFEYFKRNLEEKYIALCMYNNAPLCHSRGAPSGSSGNPMLKEPEITYLKILNTPRSKLIKIKEGRHDETAVRGFDFEFELHADIEFMKIGYETGFGINNSLGFGCVRVR